MSIRHHNLAENLVKLKSTSRINPSVHLKPTLHNWTTEKLICTMTCMHFHSKGRFNDGRILFSAADKFHSHEMARFVLIAQHNAVTAIFLPIKNIIQTCSGVNAAMVSFFSDIASISRVTVLTHCKADCIDLSFWTYVLCMYQPLEKVISRNNLIVNWLKNASLLLPASATLLRLMIWKTQRPQE